MIVPATLASIAIHCVHAHTRCMNKLSVKTEPLVRTFAILAIKPNARSSTERLEASSKRYSMPVSSFSMVAKCFMGGSFLAMLKDKKRTGMHYCFPVRISLIVRHGVLYCDCDIPQSPQRRSHTFSRGRCCDQAAR